jgi:hypothetical protein
VCSSDLQCGAFTDALKEWNRVDRTNQTWANWKTHWTCTFEEQKTIQCITGSIFSANSITQLKDDKLASNMVTSLDNLAMAAIQKNETMEKLIEMNNLKDKTIATQMSCLVAEKANTTTLLDIISRVGLKAGSNNHGGTSGGRSSRWEPQGYCWSHGYRAARSNNSTTCTSRKDGHKVGATRANTMGGSEDNKYWKPQS